jgi:hypothetical protein
MDEHAWKPAHVLEKADARCEVGLVQIPSKDRLVPARLLLLRCEEGAAMVRLDGTAVRFDQQADFPVPAIWVRAPTRGTPATGLVLNADFDIDTGRGSLPQGAGARRNRELAAALATKLAPVLADLVKQSAADWPGWSERMAARKDLKAAAFWHAFWTTVSVEAGPEASQDVQLVATHVERLFEEVLARTNLVPNGLPGDLSAFVVPTDLGLAIRCERLQQVLPALQRWPAFMNRYPVKTWCAFDVAGWLGKEQIADEETRIPELDRRALLSCLGEERRLGLENLESLAAVIQAWPQGPTEDQGWKNELEHVQLWSRTGAWKTTGSLYVPVPSVVPSLNDPLAGFLPEDMLLDTAYESSTAAWSIIRPYLSARMLPADELVRCALNARSDDSRLAVVFWLAKSLDNVLVWHYIRTRKHEDPWLFALQDGHPLLAHLSLTDRMLLLARLHPDIEHDDADPQPDEEWQPLPDLALIHSWWMANRVELVRKYDQALWPERVDRALLSNDEPDRNTWMTLFSLGVFRRFGRVRDEQNRAFLDFLHARGWWHTISQVHPDQGADQWMAILRDYAEANQVNGQFEQWMDSFPRLYRLARWCNEYIDLFRGLQYRNPQEARHLLTPAADSSLSGSGFDAPTLHRTLRVGHNLVVRELLRARVLCSETAQSMAYMPSRAVLDFMAELGYPDLERSEQIHQTLIDELGSVERASFGGDFDIPLILLAHGPALLDAVRAWGQQDASDEEFDTEEDIA